MSLPRKVRTERSAPRTFASGDFQSAFRDVCPSGQSTLKKQWCGGRTSARVTVTTTFSNGVRSLSYEDTWTCDWCGKVRVQEWMSAGI